MSVPNDRTDAIAHATARQEAEHHPLTIACQRARVLADVELRRGTETHHGRLVRLRRQGRVHDELWFEAIRLTREELS